MMRTLNNTAQHRRRRSNWLNYVMIPIIGLVLSSCGSSDQDGQADFENQSPGATLAPDWNTLLERQLASDDLSPFEREVLERARESGSISVEDYNAGWDKYKECMAETDFEIQYTTLPNQLVHYQLILPEDASQEYTDEWVEADNRCATGNVIAIEALFVEQVGNPDLLANPDEIAVQCLVNSKLVDEDYSVDDFRAEYADGFEDTQYDVMGPDAQACLAAAGIAVAVPE